jgi:REP element-mobilizing transposase RayT
VTPPRRILPGKTYLITRRCSERRLFLKPSPLVNALFLYVLAVAARRHGVLVHGFCVLSNHAHLVVTDQDGRLPAFMQYLDSLVARAINALLGRFEAFWSTDASYSAVEPLDPGDVVAKTAYVLANPVAAGLVRRGAEWPGLWSSPAQLGSGELLARRPTQFFDAKGHMPEEVVLALAPPPGFSAADFRAQVAEALENLEEQHHRQFAAEGRRFLGAARVLAQNPFTRPRAADPRFEISPRIAARDKWRRIEAIQRLKAFVAEYRAAWRERRSGVADVLFPPGTYHLRLMHGVLCAGAP